MIRSLINRLNYSLIIVLIIALLALSLIPENPLYNINWAIASTVIILLGMLMFFWRFEKSGVSSKELAMIATMASLAAISRIAFSAVASFKPATFIIMISGYVFGAQSGFIIGAVCALVSNFFLGQGPWTPWQMFAWGMCGVLAALLGKRHHEYKAFQFTLLCTICGFLYGWVLNIWHWVAFIYPLNFKTLMAVYASSFVFDVLHATANAVFAIIFGRAFYQILRRFKKYL